MTSAAAPIARSSDSLAQAVGRFVFTVIIGPLVGVFGVFIAVMLPAIPRDRPTWSEFFDAVLLLVQMGWVIGVIPALVAALVMVPLASHLGGLWQKLLLSAVIGGVSSIIGVSIHAAITGEFPANLALLVVAAPAGAVSLPICTLLFDWLLHPLLPARST